MSLLVFLPWLLWYNVHIRIIRNPYSSYRAETGEGSDRRTNMTIPYTVRNAWYWEPFNTRYSLLNVVASRHPCIRDHGSIMTELQPQSVGRSSPVRLRHFNSWSCHLLKPLPVRAELRAGQLGNWGSIPGRGKRLLSSPQRQNRLWDTPSLLSNGYRGFFHLRSGQGVKLIIHLYLVQRLGVVELYLHSWIRLHGMALSKLNTPLRQLSAPLHFHFWI
jgi:hypothetical protein